MVFEMQLPSIVLKNKPKLMKLMANLKFCFSQSIKNHNKSKKYSIKRFNNLVNCKENVKKLKKWMRGLKQHIVLLMKYNLFMPK